MKKLIQTLGLGMFILTVFIGFTSCSKDDDPADNDLFIGKYEGTISFDDLNDNGNDVSAAEGTVTVTKVGNSYNFAFGNSIPNLNGVDFEKKDNVLINIGSAGTGLIRIDAGKLTIGYTKDGKAWSADCQRK
ncbi:MULTISPECIES: hypothetical protein [Sphingobacterium]|uniref:Lipocalin-like domain-containing protein n=1 Tax=Sphingobacterium athyrii TaxID=2152717 RepID=A0A363NM41_9SPHI|nr:MULTISPECIES: hypothetical protein [Sphingobacterium]PUV21787.1 hypothetical protein DCO56_26035 [Sphingobacterium athyrii]